MQKTYWNKLTQFKYALCYFDAHLSRCVKINRGIKIFAAIASSAAIAAWATWQDLSFWWGLIIVVSQVVTAVNEFLPYKKRIKELSDIKAALTPVYNDMEKEWYYVSSGEMGAEEINKRCYYYVQKWNSIDDGFFKDDTLPQLKKCKEYAENAKNTYFETNF